MEPYVLLNGVDCLVAQWSWPFPADSASVSACREVCSELRRVDGLDVLFSSGRPPKKRVGALFQLKGGRVLVGRFGPRVLARWGASFWVWFAEMLAERLADGEQVSGTVWDLHLFVDLQGLPRLSQPLLEERVGSTLRRRRFSFREDGSFESCLLGRPEHFCCAIYDKSPALRNANYLWLAELWKRSGLLDPSLPIARVEFRYRKAEALARAGLPREPSRLLSRLSSIWHQLCRSRLWFREPNAGRKKDWARSRWWEQVAVTDFEDGPTVPELPEQTGPDPARLLAMARGVLASLVASQTGEDREAAKQRLSGPLFEFVARQVSGGPSEASEGKDE